MSADEELDSLLGPYVIGAVDADEQRRVEQHLADHGDAALEVSRLSEAFDEVLEAQATAFEPPADLWDQIARQLPDRAATGDPVVVPSTPDRPDDVVSLADHRSSRPGPGRARRRMSVIAVAAGLVVLIGVGGVVAGRAGHVSNPPDPGEVAAQVVASGNSLEMTLRSDDGTARAHVVMDDDGNAYVLPADMPVLDHGRTYQLWAEEDGQMISLGLIGDGATPAHLTVGSQPRALDISAEPAGGSVVPTVRVAAGNLS
jgi:anti-sigma-K factor RskA